jgi:hypothetical protein
MKQFEAELVNDVSRKGFAPEIFLEWQLAKLEAFQHTQSTRGSDAHIISSMI